MPFGNKPRAPGLFKQSLRGVPLGLAVRKQWGKQIIFRVRRGNGVAGSAAGVRYQDKYKYVVPASINNAESAAVRALFAAAVSNWQSTLTEQQKQEYNKRATKGLRMSGYNLYIREYINANK